MEQIKVLDSLLNRCPICSRPILIRGCFLIDGDRCVGLIKLSLQTCQEPAYWSQDQCQCQRCQKQVTRASDRSNWTSGLQNYLVIHTMSPVVLQLRTQVEQSPEIEEWGCSNKNSFIGNGVRWIVLSTIHVFPIIYSYVYVLLLNVYMQYMSNSNVCVI